MTSSRAVRSLALVASATLVFGAFVTSPAQAKKKKPPACPTATYAEPATNSESRPAPDAEIIKVTDAATAEAPVTVEFEHGAALWETVTQAPIQEDTKWFNIQIDSALPTTGLYARIDWAVPSASDIDLYIWDGATGEEATHSGATNIVPVNAPVVAETGAMGYESVSGYAAGDCQNFLVESRAFMTAGEATTLTLWLGEPTA